MTFSPVLDLKLLRHRTFDVMIVASSLKTYHSPAELAFCDQLFREHRHAMSVDLCFILRGPWKWLGMSGGMSVEE